MADYQHQLTILDSDPQNIQALLALERMAVAAGDKGGLAQPNAARDFDQARRIHRDRGELELVARLLDVELSASRDRDRQADLLYEKGRLHFEELLNEGEAVECFRRVLELRPDDASAQELLAHIGLVRENWERITKKYLDEARVSTDRQLTTSLFLSIAETYARYRPDSAEVEAYLRRALEVEPKNRRAAGHLERLLRRAERWPDLAQLLTLRVDAAASKEERLAALLSLSELAKGTLNRPDIAADAMRKVLAVDPANPRALAVLIDAYTAEENWPALVKVYEAALKGRSRAAASPTSASSSGSMALQDELGLNLQIAMIYWRRLGQIDLAEEYFRRVRKIDPSHAAMVDFYRAFHRERGEGAKLLQLLQTAHKAEQDPKRKAALAVEMAALAESEVGNPEKAIDSWKAILRQDPRNAEARQALRRLYMRTEKWNALLELLKEEIEAIPLDTGRDARVEKLLEVVAIYRDRLGLDVMVVNTYNHILTLAPDHADALDALADKYEQLGRWNDLISVLQRKADASGTDRETRVELLRRIASLWTDRFGNHAQAIKPLEELVALDTGDREAMAKLKEIYAKRRQWRALLDLLAREAATLPAEQRRAQLAEMARLASDKLGDMRAAIGVWNRILEADERDAEALAALAQLYDREKRYPALAEMYHRQRQIIGEEDARAAGAILERLGALYMDKLQAPAQAAAAFREVLALQPGHTKAIRVLREIYAQSGDMEALESLYGSLGAWDELLEVLHGVVDRVPAAAHKLAILQRIAVLASEKVGIPEKAAKAHERILAIDPQNLGAARALVPIYKKSEKWARLLATFEVLLAHTKDVGEQLSLMREIRKLCEEKLGSKALAFQWCARAYELAPPEQRDEKLMRDLQRLGAEADAWGEVADILARQAEAPGGVAEKAAVLRELGRIRTVRLHKPDDARAAWEKVLSLAPDDPEAMTALEELATQQGRWADLLTIYHRRADLEKDAEKKLELLFKIAFIEEERAANLDAAAATYEQILKADPKSQRAIRALGKVQGGRGDAGGLARALELELEHTTEAEGRVALLLRLGGLYEERLYRRDASLARYQAALALSPTNRQVHAALERFLAPGAPPEKDAKRQAERVAVARLLAPVYERSAGDEGAPRLAAALEILRAAEKDPAGRLAFDRRLVALYARKLKDPLNGYEAAVRVLEEAPDDGDNRRELVALAGELSAYDDLAAHLEKILTGERALEAHTRRDLSVELAELYDEKLENAAKAEAGWRRVLELDPREERAYAALERLLRGADRWEDLRAVLERRAENTLDAARRRQHLLQICDLYEGVLDNAAGAMEAYRRVLDLDPRSARAYKALERLYEGAGQWLDLERLLGQELENLRPGDDTAASAREARGLTFRRAELRAIRLGDPAGAVDLAEEVLAHEPSHDGGRALLEILFDNRDLRVRIARLLGPLYETDGEWEAQIKMLRGEHEMATQPSEAALLLAQVAGIQEERLGDQAGALTTWRHAVMTDPSDERARAALERLARALDRWTDAAATWEAALGKVPVDDLTLRGTLLEEVAAIYDRCLGDADNATGAYRRLLELDPSNLAAARPAAEALERLYDEQEAWAELIDILRRQAEWAETADKRINCLIRAAQIQESKLADPAAAIATWREVLAEDGENRRALDALEKLFGGRGEAKELIDVLRRRITLAKDAKEKRDLIFRVAFLLEREMKTPGEAIAAYLEVLDFAPDDAVALAELARLYRAAERWADLLEVDERRLSLAEPPGRSPLLFELGEILRDRLGRQEEALDRFREVLADPQSDATVHTFAVEAIERMLGEDGLKLAAAELLLPLYAGQADHTKLVSLLELKADALDDPRERLTCLRRVADLREFELGDPDGAFDALARACREALAEPELPDILSSLERLAAARERIADLVALYRQVAPDVLDATLQRRLHLDIADLARGKLSDVPLARDYYRRVLDAHHDDPRALAALEALYRDTGEHEALREILLRKAELSNDDPDRRHGALVEIATLCESKLGHRDEAIASWEQVLEILPSDGEAARALERLYAESERWPDLADLLERRLGFADDLDEAVDARFRLGELYEKQLSDPERAVDNYAAALSGDPQHAGAITALERYLEDAGTRLIVAEVLEPIYIARQDWPSLIRITEIRLDAHAEPEARLALTKRIARLYEEQLEDLEGAFRWYGKVFRENPEDRGVRDQLVRLCTILEKWDGLALIYQELLDDDTGDRPAILEVAKLLGDIYDRRLNDVEHARAAYRRVLVANPEDGDTFGKLEQMLTRAARWFALVEAYEEAIDAALEPARRKDLLIRIAQVQEARLTAVDKAVAAYRGVLDIDPDDEGAAVQLDRLFQEHKRWNDLAELLTTRIERYVSAGKPASEIADSSTPAWSVLRMRLADVLEHKLEEVGSAIDQYEQILAEDKGHAGAVAALERLVVQPEHKSRIAQVLEPIYRLHDWWQKLVVILDAQLEFIDDRVKRVEILREIARLHEERSAEGGKLKAALEALARAWKEDVENEDVYAELERVAEKLGAWDSLCATLDAGVEGIYDYDQAARLLARIAQIEEEKRGDRTRALAAWRRVLEVKEDEQGALLALERLYAADGQAEPLVKILEQRVDLSQDADERKQLYARIAVLSEGSLGKPEAAVTAWRQVLSHDDRDAAALDALERLYHEAHDHRALVDILAQKIELAEDPAARRALRFAAAKVYDEDVKDAFEAIGQYRAVLDSDGKDAEALEALDRLYQREQSWPELVEIIDRRAESATGADRADLLHRAAQIVEKEQGDADTAIERYRQVLSAVPTHAATLAALDALGKDDDTLEAAAAALEPVYRAAGDHDKVAELYERRLASTGSAGHSARREHFAALADAHEKGRRDSAAAFEVWARYLKEEPDDLGAQGALERLAQERGRWADLAALYEAILDGTMDSERGRFYALKLAGLYEEALGDLDRAAGRYQKALEFGGEETGPLAALDRILERQGKHAELAGVLAREAQAAVSDGEQASFLYRLGDVRERLLGDPAGAAEAYRDVLERTPRHEAARASLERLLGSPSERAQVIAILEPIYENEGDHARLADLLEAKLTIDSSGGERAALLARVAELAEKQLADPVRALDAVGRWLSEEPASEEAADELERLARLLGRWEEAAARLADVAAAADDTPEVERELRLRQGRILLHELGDIHRADAAYRRALELDATSAVALVALERIFRTMGDFTQLSEILWRRGEVEYDAEPKRQLYAEVARLREERLSDEPGAIDAWKHVLELSEGDAEAHGRLAALYERAQKWEELVEILETAARFAPDKKAEVERKRRVAEVLADKLAALDRAVDAWLAVADLAPQDDGVLISLADVHRRREDWLAVQEALVRRLGLASGKAGRIAILRDLARLAENERAAPDEAIGYLFQILDEDNTEAGAYGDLARLLAANERWHDLVEVIQRHADVKGTLGDSAGEIALLAQAADAWETRLTNADAAAEILEKILSREPGYVPALTRLARIYEAAEDWERCGQTLERALALSPSGRDAADLHYRLGRVTEAQTGELAKALPHYERALGFDKSHLEAGDAVLRAARDRGDWAQVAGLLVAREAAATEPAAKLALDLELADIYKNRLGRAAEAIPYLEAAAALSPADKQDGQVIETLADLYVASGRVAEAEPHFRRLAERAKAARRPKDVARFQQRLAALREAAGDLPDALKAYEEAFRVDPSHGATMAGLGRIYFATSDWEKARRVYRSMLLQNLDPALGVSKADVYLQLGLIHDRLGEGPKAKSMYERGLELDPQHAGLTEALKAVK